MTTQRTPVTAERASFTFYDIESLANVFSLVAYTPRPAALNSLEIFFLADDDDIVDAVDPNQLLAVVAESNPALDIARTRTTLWNLRKEAANLRLAEIVGLSSADVVCDRSETSDYPSNLRPVCDTDPDYDAAQHPFLAGYNSMNYDTVMLARYLTEVFPAPHNTPLFQGTDAARMRTYNDELFSEQHIEYMPGALGWDSPAAKVRRNMLNSGRHLDVGRLNEVQFKAALKRLLGLIGRQIKESDKLSHNTSIESVEQLYELLAYNVSDCVGLHHLFENPTYVSNFDLKAGLLAQYHETVFAKNGRVRRDRLTIDSSSAKFVGRILAPYKPLNDIQAVSFVYPHPEVAKERGIESVNVLDECVKFFEENVAPDPTVTSGTTTAQRNAHAQFMQVVRYYRSIEGQNFNESDEYDQLFGDERGIRSLPHIPKTPNNVPYFHADASPSSCFATFSTGGIHGAEADTNRFMLDRITRIEQDTMLHQARTAFPDAKEFVRVAKDQHNALSLPDGSTVDKRLVLIGSDPAKVRYRKAKKDDANQNEQLARAQQQVPEADRLLATQRPDSQKLNLRLDDGTLLEGKVVLATTSEAGATYRDQPALKEPELFVEQKGESTKGSTKLNPKYTRTSAGLVIHEDFTSYYPNLLRNMRAFYNPELGEDRYAKIFFDKEHYGQEMKQPGLTAAEKTRLSTLRNGTKLILNSASGAGDATHRTPIRMNNQIISMRILGQLFSWRIGQAQTLAGARIISTNTDGLYSVVGGENGFDEATNNRVLAEQEAAIGVDIEPELMFLISKDSNNRLELQAPRVGHGVTDSKIISASGSTLACHGGPMPTKSLAHPAVVDFALARYLQTIAARGEASLAEPFDPDLGRKLIQEAINPADPVGTLLLFQNIIAASRGSITYPFAADPVTPESAEGGDDSEADAVLGNPRALQMVNRVFVVRGGTSGAVSLHNAGAWKINPASIDKRQKDGRPSVRRDPTALEILRHHGWARHRYEAGAGDGLSLLPDDHDTVIRRINGIDPTWSMIVKNDDLYTLTDQVADELIASLDLDIYTQMLSETFTKNWKNVT